MGTERSIDISGPLDVATIKQWIEFKKGWSEADQLYWDQLMGKTKTDNGKLYLKAISPEEILWSSGLVKRAESAGLFPKNLNSLGAK